MLKKKIIAITLIFGTLLMSYSVYANTNLKDTKNKVATGTSISINKTGTVSKEVKKTSIPQLKHEEIKDLNIIKNDFPVKEQKPTVDLGNLKEISTTGTRDTYGPSYPQNNVYRIITEYKSSSGKDLMIVQGNAYEYKGSTSYDIINKTGTTKVKGVDAVICEAKGGFTQITFIKDKKFYNVLSSKMTKEELIKIAESLK